MTEEEELIEETEVLMRQGLHAYCDLLGKRVDALKATVDFDALKFAPKKRRAALRRYIRRLEAKYYAALQRRGFIGVTS